MKNMINPTVTQLGREGAKIIAPGEMYIVQLCDGSYIIIDGGFANDDDERALWDFLVSHNPNKNQKPTVSWMFTHNHPDHVHLALKFLEEKYEDITLERLCYNFPDFNKAVVINENTQGAIHSEKRINDLLADKYTNTERIIFETGDVLDFAGCKVEILYTHKDFTEASFPYVNHTSSAWRMNFSTGKSFLVPGDCEKSLCRQMAEKYGEYLKSDVFHTTHHGFNGGELSFYKLVNPTICFWPVDRERFENDPRCLGTKSPNYDFNLWIRESCKQHYPDDVTVTVDMATLEIV